MNQKNSPLDAAIPKPRHAFRLPPETAAQGLCTRCGYCAGICPLGLVELDHDLFPRITPENLERCTRCALCVQGCAADIDLRQANQKLFGRTPHVLDAVGVVQNLYCGHAVDPAIRYGGASGGVVTALLLNMLDTGEIDQALVCGMNENRPWEPKPVLAGSKAELLAGAQSKYNIVPQLIRMKEIINSGKKTAIVGLPCHLHGFRKLEQRQSRLSEKIPLVIGLACDNTLERRATEKLLEINNIPAEQVVKLEYRGGDERWGNIRVRLADGSSRRLHAQHNAKDLFKHLALLYTPQRCLTCIDFSAELSDLTVLDPNLRDANGCHRVPEKLSLVLVRNDRGQAALDRAVAGDVISLREIPADWLPSQFDLSVRKKKIGAPIRIDRLKQKNRPYPCYDVIFPPPSLRDRLHERVESCTRVFSKSERTRNVALRFVFSGSGIFLSHLVSMLKKRRL